MARKTIGIVLAMKDQFTSGAKKATASTKTLNRELKHTEKQLQNLGKNALKFAKIGATAIGAVGVASIKMSMDFSKSVAKVSTIADESVVSMKDMRAEILKLSNETGASANALAEDVYNAISAGVDSANAVATVATTTKLAKAGFAETGESLDLLTTIVNGYGKSIEEAEKISDILITTQNKGKVTVGELSSSMGKIIPTANAMNVGLEQVASGYALMTANGIKSAEATTYMNSMINELGKSGTKASKNLEKATGKTFTQLMNDGYSLGDVLAELEKEAKKSNLSMMDMFGSAEAGKASLILAKNEGNDFNAMMKEMQNSTGATQTAFDKLDAEPLEKLNKSVNRLKNRGIELGIMLLPTVNKLFDGLLKLTEIPLAPYFETVLGKIKSTVEFFQKNWGTIGPILATVTAGVVAYKTAMVAVLLYTKAVTLATAIKTGVLATGATAVNLMSVAQWALNAAMTANPIGLVIAGITALIAIIVLVVKHFDSIKEKMIQVWEWTEPLRKVAQHVFMPWLTPLKLIFKALDKVFNLGAKIEKLKFWKKDKNAESMAVETDAEYGGMEQFAKGGIATKPSIFGEAGPEMAIPLNKSKRSQKLLAQANRMIGGGNKTTNLSKNINHSNASTVSKVDHENHETFVINIYGNVYGEDDLIDKIGSAIVQKVKRKISVVT